MINYNIDTDIREKVLIFILIVSIFISIFFTKKIDYIKTIHKINLSPFAEALLNTLPLPSIFGIIYCLFDKRLWRINLFKFFLGIPDLNGEWEGKYWSNFKCLDPDNCKCKSNSICSYKTKGFLNNRCMIPESEKECLNYVENGVEGKISFNITQTFTKILIYSNHQKSSSKNRVTSMFLENKPDRQMTLLYEHLNEVDIFEADYGMKNHSGFNQLDYFKEKNQEVLQGIYYNDPNRQTYGKVRYIKINDH